MLSLRVMFDEKFTFKEHMHAKINRAYMMLGITKRNFKYLTVSTFVIFYSSMVRSQFDYYSSVWAPYTHTHVRFMALWTLSGITQVSRYQNQSGFYRSKRQ